MLLAIFFYLAQSLMLLFPPLAGYKKSSFQQDIASYTSATLTCQIRQIEEELLLAVVPTH